MAFALQDANKTSTVQTFRRRTVRRGLFVGLTGALMAVSLAPIWMNEYFLSQNGPVYLLFIQMLKEFSNPEYGYSDYYTLWSVLIPNLSVPFLVLLLSYAFPLFTAYKIVLSLVLTAFPLSVFYFLSVVRPRNLALGAFSILYVYNYFTFKGYENFFLSISLALFFMGYFIKHRDDLHTARVCWLGALLFVVYLTHLFSFMLLCMIVPIYLMLSKGSRREFEKAAVIAAPTIVLFLHYMYEVALTAGTLLGARGSWLRYDNFHWTVDRYLRMAMTSVSETAAMLFFIPMSVVFCLAGWKLWKLAREQLLRRPGREPLFAVLQREKLLCLAVVLTISYFVAPREIAGWPKFNERFLPFIMVFLLAAVDLPPGRIVRRGLLVMIGLVALSLNLVFAREIADANRELDVYLSGIPMVERNKTLLPVQIDDSRRVRVRPLRWAFNYYNIAKGGATGDSVVQAAGRVPMRYIEAREEMLPLFDASHPEDADMDRIGEVYDYVLMWGHDEAIDAEFHNAGFEVIHRRGKLRLYQNTRCGATGG